MTGEIENRLTDLEIRMAHQERMAEELSDVLNRQNAMIESLVLQFKILAERLAELEAGWSRSPQDEAPPPHY